MALSLEDQLKIFLASAPQNKRVIQTLELSHSAIVTRYVWREPYTGQVTLEDASIVTIQPINMVADIAMDDQTLDQAYQFTIDTVNINDEFRNELDKIPLDTEEKIVAVYREFLSDNLTEPAAIARLQVENIAYNKGTATLSAVTPRLNITRTGELYTYKRFPMLRGFI